MVVPVSRIVKATKLVHMGERAVAPLLAAFSSLLWQSHTILTSPSSAPLSLHLMALQGGDKPTVSNRSYFPGKVTASARGQIHLPEPCPSDEEVFLWTPRA